MVAIELTTLSTDDDIGLREVIALAKTHRATLGFLPDSAFRERAQSGNLIVARRGELVLGYCLFDLPRAGHIKLVHVCVADLARGLQLGNKLILRTIELNPLAIGVLAYCRRDYRMDRFWASAACLPEANARDAHRRDPYSRRGGVSSAH
jgi:hypothetical protein